MKQEGKPNDLIERIQSQAFFKPIVHQIKALTDPATFTGRSSQIVESVVANEVKSALERYQSQLGSLKDADLKV